MADHSKGVCPARDVEVIHRMDKRLKSLSDKRTLFTVN
jgi:hypothetical protein